MQKLFLYVLRGAMRLILFIVGSADFKGRENIPAQGPYIIVTNHMSKADAPLLFLALPIPPLRLRFFAGEKWEKNPLYGPLMKAAGAVYINRGEVDRQALKEAIDAINSGEVFGLAPEGTRSRVRSLIRAKDGAAYLTSRTNAPLLPMAVINTDVVGENFSRLRRTRMECRIGQPFTLPDLGRRARTSDLAAYTHYIMIQIAAMLPERYYGYYQDSPALAALRRGEDPWPYCLEAEGVQP